MNPEIRQQYEAIRETLDRCRTKAQRYLWSLGVGMLLALVAGLPEPSPIGGVFAVVGWIAFSGGLLGLMLNIPCTSKIECFPCGACGEGKIPPCNNIWKTWVCGFCAKTHPGLAPINLWGATLVDPCKKCDRLQHSIVCRECRAPIVWDEDGFRRQPNTSAWYLGSPPPPPEEPKAPEERPPRPIDEDLR
jgi:hypothetical protein